MKVFALIIAFSFLAFTIADRVDVPTDGHFIDLVPTASEKPVETVYELHAPAGSKMLIVCNYKTDSCDIAKITIDNGQFVSENCPNDLSFVFKFSHQNRMNVTIAHSGNQVGATCHVKATKPYLHIPEVQVDSSEHGLAEKSKKAPSCKCGWTNKPAKRIAGGLEAGVNEYPFPVLLARNGEPFCGGSIITPHHILTSSFCTNEAKDQKLTVIVGEHNVNSTDETSATHVHDVSEIFQHEDYNEYDDKNDVAVLELATPIEFNDKVGPVCLPTMYRDLKDKVVKSLGWGLWRVSMEGQGILPALHKVNLKVVDPQICNVIYDMDPENHGQFCTYNYNKETCPRDNGGPVVIVNPETNMYEQVGIVSYGSRCMSTNPGVKTNVAAFLPWIQEKIAKSSHASAALCS